MADTPKNDQRLPFEKYRPRVRVTQNWLDNNRDSRRQPTIDGKPHPPSPIQQPEKKGGHQRTHFDHKVQEEAAARAKKPTKGPRTPAEERAWQESKRLPELDKLSFQHKMDNILDWHSTCPTSQAYPPEDDPETDSWDEQSEELLDLKRYPFCPPKGEEAFFEE